MDIIVNLYKENKKINVLLSNKIYNNSVLYKFCYILSIKSVSSWIRLNHRDFYASPM